MGKKLSILHTESSMGWGGQEIRIIQESIKFTELGYRVLIACQEGSQIARQADEAGLQVFIVRMRFACDPIAIAKFLRIIRQEKVDIIHTHSSKDSWIAGMAGRICSIPIVRSRHLSTPVGKNWLTTFVYRYLADTIITSGMHIKKTLVADNKLDSAKIISIPAGVDTERYNINITGDKIKREFGLEESFPVVGIVAILRSWKGHRYLLEAVPKVISAFPDAKFLVVGDGPQWKNLHKIISNLGIEEHVIMAGFRNDIPDMIAALDIFVLPSIDSEATSQVIPQALSMGKPVIATNVGGLPEIIEDGVTGLIVPPKDHNAISEAIIWMANNGNNAKEMAVKGREKVLKDYTLKKMIDCTGEVYCIHREKGE